MDSELVKLLQQISPVIWEVALRQNAISGYLNIFFGIVLLIIAMVAIYTLSRMYKNTKEFEAAHDEYNCRHVSERYDHERPTRSKYAEMKGEVIEVICWVISFFFPLWGTPLVVYGMMYLYNPIYWTLHSLIVTAQ